MWLWVWKSQPMAPRSCLAGSGAAASTAPELMARAATTSDSFNAVAEPRRRLELSGTSGAGCWGHRGGPEDGAPVSLEASNGCCGMSGWSGCDETGDICSIGRMRKRSGRRHLQQGAPDLDTAQGLSESLTAEQQLPRLA